MTDFNQYTYSRTLEVLDGQYERDTDPTNYANYLLSMSDATSIRQCIKIYNRVYKKYCQLFSMGWSGHKETDYDLARCLNENIIRILKSREKASAKDVLQFFSNLRQCDEIKDYQKEIESYATRMGLVDTATEETFKDIQEAKVTYDEAVNKIHYEYLEPGTNGYKKAYREIKESRQVLKENGYVLCESDYSLPSNFSQWIFYALAVAIIIILAYYFGGLLIIALPIIGWYAIWKG